MKFGIILAAAIATFGITETRAQAARDAYLVIKDVAVQMPVSGAKGLGDAQDVAHGHPIGKRTWVTLALDAGTGAQALQLALEHHETLASITLVFDNGPGTAAETQSQFQGAAIYSLQKVSSGNGELTEVSFTFTKITWTGAAIASDNWLDPRAHLEDWAAHPLPAPAPHGLALATCDLGVPQPTVCGVLTLINPCNSYPGCPTYRLADENTPGHRLLTLRTGDPMILEDLAAFTKDGKTPRACVQGEVEGDAIDGVSHVYLEN